VSALHIEYGTTNPEDTCVECFLLHGREVQATWEVFREDTERVPVCNEHVNTFKHPLRVN